VIFSGAALILVSGCDNLSADTRATAPATTSVGTKIDDSVITARVKSALLADPDVKSFDIAAVTCKGEVQLYRQSDQIDHASELARAVDGVKSVANEMSVKK
jgi:hyperosmotically inducible protein